MCLPSHFKGGELVIRHRNGTATFDWATEVKGTPAETGQVPVIAWTFLFSDCDHEVLPVTEGTRITIAYDVFIVPCNDTERSKFRDPAVEELSATLRAALKNPSFFPDGGAMAFGLQHAYPIQTFDAKDTDDHYIGGHLKGVDQMWLSAAKAVGLEWSICGMYDFELNDSNHWGTPPPRGNRYIYRNRDYAAAKGFELFEGASFGEYGSMDVHGSSMFTDKNVAWVTMPGDWSGTNSYMTYGNEVSGGLWLLLIGSGIRRRRMSLSRLYSRCLQLRSVGELVISKSHASERLENCRQKMKMFIVGSIRSECQHG